MCDLKTARYPGINEMFIYKGYNCLIRQIDCGDGIHSYLCGYVELPYVHPGWNRDYDDSIFETIDVHGGLTFGGILSYFNPNWEGYWIGFDCNHGGLDAVLGTDPEEAKKKGLHIWTPDDVFKEIKKLVDQVDKIHRDL